MNADAIKRLLTALSSAVKIERGQLYQAVQAAEASYYLRDIHSQHEIGLLLRSFGYPFNQVGKFYESIYLYRTGQYEKARELLQCVADFAPAPYKSKALLSLSAVEERIGRFEESLKLRLQIPSVDDPLTELEIRRGIAALRSIEGEHQAALRELERLMPLAHIIGRHGHPSYLTFLNSYALELSETGKAEVAQQVASVIAASPLITLYPEWQETVSEIAQKRRRSSVVAVDAPVPRDSRVQAAIDFMQANMHRSITLEDLAGLINVSISHLLYLFHEEVGYPPIEYLIRLRMEKARELLAGGSYSVKEVMGMVGYNPGNRAGFTRQFKRLSNDVTPSEYKRRARARR